MRARRLSPAGRFIVYLLSFLMVFSSVSTFTLQSVQAAVSNTSARVDEALPGMLSVASVVGNSWSADRGLRELLNERDTRASEYSRINGLLGTSTRSGSLGKTDNGEWLSNAMYEGTILREGSFSGYKVKYNDDSDSVVIKDGINKIDAVVIPFGDENITEKGSESDISSWDMQYGFASRFMQPYWNDDGMDLKHGRGYHTTLYIAGIKGGNIRSDRIYTGKMMSYVEFLAYIGAEPSDANMAAYLDYVNAYKNMDRDWWTSVSANGDWQDWRSRSSSDDDDDDDHHSDNDDSPSNPGGSVEPPSPVVPDPVTPVRPGTGRVIMMYMDVSDLEKYAKEDLTEIIRASNTSAGDNSGLSQNTRIYILTGGSDGDDVVSLTVDGNTYEVFGSYNQLWEVRDGSLKAISQRMVGDMTDPSTLSDFIDKVKSYDLSHYNNEKQLYDLIMWGHGYGPEKGFGEDNRYYHTNANSSGTTLSLSEIVEALKDSGIPEFDFISFDSCYMSNLETALALAYYSHYLIASETKLPADGLDYSAMIKALIENPDIETYMNVDGTLSGLGKILVDSCVSKYNSQDKKASASLSVVDLETLLLSTEGYDFDFYETLINLSDAIYSSVNGFAYYGVSESLYELLSERGAFLSKEGIQGKEGNDLVDLTDFCNALIQYEKNTYGDVETGKFRDACEKLIAALEEAVYSRSVVETDSPGSTPLGISVYFPSQQRQYTGNGSSQNDHIEALLKVYNETVFKDDNADAAMKAYRKAIASYGLWLKTGELMRKTWATADVANRINSVRDLLGIDADVWSTALGMTDPAEMITNIITEQINDSIKINNVSVTVADGKKTLHITNVNPDFVDRVEVKVSVKTGDNTNQEKVSLGYSDSYSKEVTGNNNSNNSANFELTKFDNKWLSITDGQVVSYYDESYDPTTGRKGIIPVAYWTGKTVENNDGEMTIQEAVEKGYLILGVFEVEFEYDAENNQVKSTGTIKGFRNLSDDSLKGITHNLGSGDKYELLGNFDEAGDNNENLVTLGSIKLSDTNVYKDNEGNTQVKLADVSELGVEYRIVDAYESRYELNSENFPNPATGTNDKNLDGYQEESGNTGEKITVTSSKTINVSEEPGYSEDTSRTEVTKSSDEETETSVGEPPLPPVGKTETTVPAGIDPSMVTDEMINNAILTGMIDPSTVTMTGDPAVDSQALRELTAAAMNEASKSTETEDTETITDEALTGNVTTQDPTQETAMNNSVNPLTGEGISSGETSMENSDGSGDVSAEYVTPGLSDDQNASYENSDSGDSDKGSGDGGDSGSSDDDDDDSSSDSDGDSSDSDSSSDDGGSSDSSSSSESDGE